MKEFLDSDRVNFLVWRYLLEGNYRETAAKFQKEWHMPEPHRHFDFAPHVKSHALVSVLNRGLLYYSLERDFLLPKIQPADAATQPLGIFGPLITQAPPSHKEEAREETAAVESKPVAAPLLPPPPPSQPPAAATATVPAASIPPSPVVGTDEADNSRKRLLDKQQPAGQTGSPAKKAKLSNGYDAATAAAVAAAAAVTTTTTAGGGAGADAVPPTPMDIDNVENQHAYPSPMEREPASTPVPRTDGPEQGTQVDKVEELAPETTFLRLAPDQLTGNDRVAETQQPGHENPIVLHCEWSPRNPSVLAAAGTDALARIWTLSRAATSADPASDHVITTNQPYKDLVEEDGTQTSTVTAMAWNGDGTALAIATDSGSKARVGIWSPDGTLLLRYTVQEPPVIKLRWNPNGVSILGIAPANRGALVTIFSAVTSSTASYVLADHDLSEYPLDAAWINESDFLVCGGDLLLTLHWREEAGIVLSKTFATNKNDGFVQIQYDWRSKLVATASEKGVIDLWDEFGERRTISAHIGMITSLMWQPLQSTLPNDDERLLASGGEDGAITIWNARLPDSKPKCSMTMDLPVAALSFTPDGAFIAGATADRILIWKVGEHAIPRASWRRPPHPGWLSPKTSNSDSEEEDTHCLCWDVTGQKLAYGVNNRLAVINFR